MAATPPGTSVVVDYLHDGQPASATLTTVDPPQGRSGSVMGMTVNVRGYGGFSVAFAQNDIGGPSAGLMLTLGIIGLGQGMVISPNQTLTLSEVPLKYAGSAGGVLQTGQRIGTSIGIAVITTAVFSTVGSRGWGIAFAVGFAAVVVTTLVAMALGVVDLVHSRRAAAKQA